MFPSVTSQKPAISLQWWISGTGWSDQCGNCSQVDGKVYAFQHFFILVTIAEGYLFQTDLLIRKRSFSLRTVQFRAVQDTVDFFYVGTHNASSSTKDKAARNGPANPMERTIMVKKSEAERLP